MTLPDFFDINDVGSDSHLQFLNWTVDNNGAWDYAADTRGYTVGGMAEYDDRDWSIRYGIFAMPVGKRHRYGLAFSRAHGQNGEFELRQGFMPKRKGTQRVLFYANRAHMGTYREAVDAFLASITQNPTSFSMSIWAPSNTASATTPAGPYRQSARLFGRFGWNEGQHESFAYTEVDQTVEVGADFAGSTWHRPSDKIALAFVSNAIKRDHQNYLRLGGLGFLLGDGNLNYGRENIIKSHYTWHAWRGLFYESMCSTSTILATTGTGGRPGSARRACM